MNEYRSRHKIFIAVVVVILAVLGGRLAYLQVAGQERYEKIAEGNAVHKLRVTPARGAFYDRDGTLLVGNRQMFTLTVIPRYFDESKSGLLADLLEVPDSVFARKLAEARAWNPFRPSALFRDVPFETFSRIEERLSELPGVDFSVGQKRTFPTAAKAAHTLGYVREIGGAELREMAESGYRMGDLIGQAGLEQRYEPYLRGRMGSEFRLVSTRGVDIGSFEKGQEDQRPVSGYDLHLTLDADVQALAESLFVNKRGGAVAIDPKTGGILSIVSKPDFDPALFAGAIEDSTWSRLTQHWSKPMLNRATMSRMPPGSTWKPFMALMALQEGLVDSTETVFCPGYHPFGGPGLFRCLHRHGAIGVVEAIQHSCNTFFFEMMYRGNVGMLKQYGHLFGFGERAPTDLMEQVPGLMPDSAYFRQKTGVDDWGKGWTLSLGIGQGDMAVTPLQMAVYMATVANGGTRYAPHLIDHLKHPANGEVLRPVQPEPKELPIEPAHFETVRKGMRLVMEAGTGYWVQIPGIPSGGKTGTAQNSHGEDHSIFIMFAPYDDPEIAIAVMVENAGYGSTAAGPIASLMAEQYIRGELSDTRETERRLAMVKRARSELPAQVAAR